MMNFMINVDYKLKKVLMTNFTEKYADIWGDNPQQLMTEYDYQP